MPPPKTEDQEEQREETYELELAILGQLPPDMLLELFLDLPRTLLLPFVCAVPHDRGKQVVDRFLISHSFPEVDPYVLSQEELWWFGSLQKDRDQDEVSLLFPLDREIH